jgi:hypothetical protein
MLARRAAIPRRLRNLVRPVPTVADDSAPLPVERAPGAGHREQIEAFDQRQNAESQRLSRELAHLYRRDVAASGNLGANVRHEYSRGGSVPRVGNGAPAVGYMFSGSYGRMVVSFAMAQHLLRRDGGSASV